MATLDQWRKFLSTPTILVLPHLELIGCDHAPPLIVGAGEIRVTSLDEFEFTLKGVPKDIGYALAELNRARDNPYDGLARPRLVGTDDKGIRWAGGYTVPRVDPRDNVWIVSGEIESLFTDDQSAMVARQASTELLFPLRIGDPMAIEMARFVRTNCSEVQLRQHELEILGSKITFLYDASAGSLSITALHSTDLPATYTENWLGEPLRILFGQLIYPRLVARNFGDGRAVVYVRRCPGLIRSARWAALWGRDELTQSNNAFWSTYSALLSMIAQARDADGQPNFEAHNITRIYEEVIQASLGSRWVWALTFATSIEALVNMLIPKKTVQNPDEAKTVAAMVGHIKVGPGDSRLKAIAANALHRTLNISTIRAMRELRAANVITEPQLSAWQTVRNAVAHGSLLSRYSNKEGDTRLVALSTMMHAVIKEILHRSSASK